MASRIELAAVVFGAIAAVAATAQSYAALQARKDFARSNIQVAMLNECGSARRAQFALSTEFGQVAVLRKWLESARGRDDETEALVAFAEGTRVLGLAIGELIATIVRLSETAALLGLSAEPESLPKFQKLGEGLYGGEVLANDEMRALVLTAQESAERDIRRICSGAGSGFAAG